MSGIIYKVKQNATNLIKINISMMQCVEMSSPKTINITQYLSTNNFSVNNRHFVIKSSQTTQRYITTVFYKQFSCHDYIKKIIFRQIF
jgi:mRNA-degrading endonuclease HigB of HigAB toxin-antitoxin module